MTLGKRIARLRKENGLLQKNLAAVLGVSIGTVSNYEHDTHQPDLAVLVIMADFFSVSLDYLLGRSSFRHSVHCADVTLFPNGINLSAVLEQWQAMPPKEQARCIAALKQCETPDDAE